MYRERAAIVNARFCAILRHGFSCYNVYMPSSCSFSRLPITSNKNIKIKPTIIILIWSKLFSYSALLSIHNSIQTGILIYFQWKQILNFDFICYEEKEQMFLDA